MDNRGKDRGMARRPKQRQRGKIARRPGRRYQSQNGRAHPGRRKVVVNRPQRTIVRQQPVINNTYISRGRRGCAPVALNYYDPFLYTDYRVRRSYRRYNACPIAFLSLGFFLARPYSYYNYATIDYSQPFVYGDDRDYRPAPIDVDTTGGPLTEDATGENLASAPPVQTASSTEQIMLTELSGYVEANSTDGYFLVPDAAFDNQTWKLELTQAPAVYMIDQGLYSVVAGFEGTLGESSMPSNVGLEFFMVRKDNGWEVRDVWLVSANGIAREKQFQSPAHPQVKTWQAGTNCPFTGQLMVPISHG